MLTILQLQISITGSITIDNEYKTKTYSWNCCYCYIVNVLLLFIPNKKLKKPAPLFQLFLPQQTMFYPMLRFVLLMTQRIRDNSSHYSSVTTVRRSSFILFYVLYPRRIFINDDTCLYRLWHQINLQSLYNRIYFGVKYNATLMARKN